MKVLLVNGSSHKNGTTMQAIREMVSVFEKEGVETEVIQLGGKPLADCLQCGKCRETGHCVFEDDGVNDFVEKARTADGFVFASPVYYAHPSGRILSFLDRAFFSNSSVFQFKPGAAIAVPRRGGASASFDCLCARACRGRCSQGRGRHADHAQPCPQHDLDDALLCSWQGTGYPLSPDRKRGCDQFYPLDGLYERLGV